MHVDNLCSVQPDDRWIVVLVSNHPSNAAFMVAALSVPEVGRAQLKVQSATCAIAEVALRFHTFLKALRFSELR